MRADIHDGQERERSTQGPDTEAQDQQSPDHHSGLQRTAGPYRCATNGLMHRSKIASLLDHLVGADQQRCGKLNTERPGALEVDDELEFDGPLDRQVRRRGALQYLVYESR
jgi:hypothetical protein